MRAVRCDVCGAKAMIAAAKCPTCGHMFKLRDGFGELLPLAYCSSCASYYPESVGECRWCGTKPERPPIGPRIWRGAGAVLAAGLGVLWLLRNGSSEDDGRTRSKAAATPSAAVASAPAAVAPLSTDTAVARVVAMTDSAPAPQPTMVAPDSITPDTAPAANVAAGAAPTNALPSGPVIAQQPRVATKKTAAPVASSTRRPATRWVRSVSRHWVIIRTGASSSSRIVASIGPNSRVELGESRGSWRRIRAKGLTGWVEPRSSFELVASR